MDGAWLTEPGHETWVAWVRGTPAGYAELVRRDGEVEIENFGLVPSFIGRGLVLTARRLLHPSHELRRVDEPQRDEQ